MDVDEHVNELADVLERGEYYGGYAGDADAVDRRDAAWADAWLGELGLDESLRRYKESLSNPHKYDYIARRYQQPF